jgi:NAD(P)-dependent dehydrogenase (short-subunit alcohol dehydrogenase family)
VKVLLIGATGTLGTAVTAVLRGRGHEVVTVGRTGGDVRADVADPAQTARVFAEVRDLDAVISAAGDVPYKAVVDMTPEDYLSGYRGKVAAQIELVRQGTTQIAERGSFTLIAGVLGQEPIITGSAAAMANGALEAFVRAAALEIAPQRVNAVSPTVFTESMAKYEAYFPRDHPRAAPGRRTGLRPLARGRRDGSGLPRAVAQLEQVRREEARITRSAPPGTRRPSPWIKSRVCTRRQGLGGCSRPVLSVSPPSSEGSRRVLRSCQRWR